MEIQLTQDKVAVVDDSDLVIVGAHRWYAWKWVTKSGTCRWYAMTNVARKTVKMHRLILGLKPGDPDVDHRDKDGLNNRRANLRLATQSQNNANSSGYPTRRKSKYRGVCRRLKRDAGTCWVASVQANGKMVRRYAKTELEAARLYDDLALRYFGEFAQLNKA